MAEDRVIKVAVLGLNQGSKSAKDAQVNPRTELIAVAGFGEESEKMAEELGVKRYDDYRDLLSQEKGDGVVISLPNELHLPATKCAIENGWKHILLEKPISTTVEEAREIIRLCEEAGATLLIGHQRRSANRYLFLKDFVKSGRLGQIVGIQVTYAGEKRPGYWEGWHAKRTGGPVLMNAIHDLDDLDYILEDKPQRVYAALRNTIRGNEAEDSCNVMLEYANGVVVTYFLSDGTPSPWCYDVAADENIWIHACPGENSMRIYGTKGSFGFPNMDFYYYDESEQLGWHGDMHHEHFDVEKCDPMAAELDHFVDLCLGITDKPRCTGENSLHCMQVIDAIFKSADTGMPVEVE